MVVLVRLSRGCQVQRDHGKVTGRWTGNRVKKVVVVACVGFTGGAGRIIPRNQKDGCSQCYSAGNVNTKKPTRITLAGSHKFWLISRFDCSDII